MSALADMTAPLRPAILWGARGHAKVLNEFLPRVGSRVVAVFDNDASVSSPIPGVPIFHGLTGFKAWLNSWELREPLGALVAIGGSRGQTRLEIQKQLLQFGIPPLTVIHPTAFVAADARLDAGCQVLANASVATDAALGLACLINTNASVDHESALSDGVHVAPGATITGCVTIGAHSFIGAGAIVLPRIKIGRDVIIGAGAVVTRDIPDGKVAYGNPARIIRDNKN